MAYSADISDIEGRWRPLSEAERTVAETLLEDAGALLDVRRPGLAAKVAGGQVPERLVTMALVRVVKRVLRNLDEVKAQQIGADGAIGITFPSSTTTTAVRDGLYFLDDDLAEIDQALAATGGRRARTGSVGLTAYDQRVPDLTILPTA